LNKYGHGRFKIGESDSGRKLKVTMRQYIEYMLYTRDDSPLYLFESNLEEHDIAKEMMKDYKPPKFFKENLFALVNIILALQFI
jgi:histone arginine demethylase JMJD6